MKQSDKKWGVLILLGILLFSACSQEKAVGLDPEHPITITIWHYYNGLQKNVFDEMVEEFNETVGREKGILVEGHNKGDITQLEQSIAASMNKEVGSDELPNIFASYADTAYAAEKLGYLADLDFYLSDEDIARFVPSYIEEGRIGEGGELKIFPTAKSTEVFMINKTVWDSFSKETGIPLSILDTKEGVAAAAEKYYHWTDEKTPDIEGDGKAFYGRDAVANLFIVGAKQLGVELFHVEKQKVTLNLDKEVLKRIWEVSYIPFIKGYFAAEGRFRSDDAKVGIIAAYTGSSTSAAYFPKEIIKGETVFPVDCLILPVPVFEGGTPVAVQQGAGMVVTRTEEKQEYASILFLKWFTEPERNLRFSYASGYLPVRKDAYQFSLLEKQWEEDKAEVPEIVKETLFVAFDTVAGTPLYTNKAFAQGSDARKILEYDLMDKAKADLKQIRAEVKGGKSRQEAEVPYLKEENFDAWYQAFVEKLMQAVQ